MDRSTIGENMVWLLRAAHSSREAVAGVLACEPAVRRQWARIAAARLRELGDRGEIDLLCDGVSTLGVAATSVHGERAASSLAETGFDEVERSVFGVPACEAPAAPTVLRALGATADLVEGLRGVPQQMLPDIDPRDPAHSWVAGRVLCMPDVIDGAGQPKRETAVLNGQLDAPSASGPGEEFTAPAMEWVLEHPWAFLLAQLVFTQEAWAAERVSGHLALELEESHLPVFSNPPQVRVVVTTAEGDEIACGTLGGLALRVLAELGVVLLTADASEAKLDDALRSVIGVLLERNVWRFDHGLAGGRPSYEIHSRFSDECYRALGSRSFYRRGASVTLAIRQVCEAWTQELLGASDGKAKQ